MPEYVTPKEVQEMADCTASAVYEALWCNELKGFQRSKPKGRWLIESNDARNWIRGVN